MVFTLALRHQILFFQIVAIANIALIFSGRFGVLTNNSMSGCFAAVLMPLLPAWARVLSAVAILYAHQSQPLALLFAECAMILFLNKQYRVVFLAVPVLALAVGYTFLGGSLLDSSGRYGVWGMTALWWEAYANYLTGMGSGSYRAIGPYIMRGYEEVFIWLHSDWLQTIFEQGLVGFTLSLGIFVWCLKAARPASRVLSSVALYGAWMLANYPLRLPLSALYGAFLVRLSLYEAEQAWRGTEKPLANFLE